MSIEITPTEERSIIALALDEPTFFSALIDQVDPHFFNLDEARYVYRIIKHCYDSKGEIPSRQLVRDLAEKTLETNDNFEEILEICDYEISLRDYDIIKDRFISWLRSRTLDAIYDDNVIESVRSGDYNELEKIVNRAARIQSMDGEYLWFFKQLDVLFDEEVEVKYTTGFPELDQHINEGGPTKGDVMVFMAPTGSGKSIVICNNVVACLKRGLRVLHVTCELSDYKTACRYSGIISRVNIKNRFSHSDRVRELVSRIQKTYKCDLIIKEFPPDTINIRHISTIVDDLEKRYNWRPDVIAIDYLELMLSENQYFNRDDYKRQKKVATEVRQLAKTTGTYIITATQTNRDSKRDGKDELLDINRVSESYGKMMPVDYVVSINQSRTEYCEFSDQEKKQMESKDDGASNKDKNKIPFAKMRLYIAKNRNGPKFKTINTLVNFNTMFMTEGESKGE